jgi:hypothetical protein
MLYIVTKLRRQRNVQSARTEIAHVTHIFDFDSAFFVSAVMSATHLFTGASLSDAGSREANNAMMRKNEIISVCKKQ